MAVTLIGIAWFVKVDAGSFSCVLRKHPKAVALKPDTRKRIIEAAERLRNRRK